MLSGGTSTRFGQEKGLVTLDGEPMVRLVTRTMQSLTDEVVVAVARGRSPDYHRLLGNGVIVVEDEQDGGGPLLGLTTALRGASGEYVIVSPCDTPLLKPEMCKIVINRGKGKDGAVPRVRGYLEPLHASYRRKTCLDAFERSLSDGMRRPKDAYRLLELAIVEEADIRVHDPTLESFMNINTREDLFRIANRQSCHR